MKKTIYVAFFFIITTTHCAPKPYPAVVVSPIADLLLYPMSKLSPEYKNGLSYQEIPISGQPQACVRIHQLRANDRVTVINELANEVQVQVPSFQCHLKNNRIQESFWMLKKDLVPLHAFKSMKKNYIPEPISVGNPIPHGTVTLAHPWRDSVTKTLFSAGTRFALSKSDAENYSIFIFNPTRKRYITVPCPIAQCIAKPSQDLSEQRQQMIALIRAWIADTQEGFIPYALGGCSITTKITHTNPPHVRTMHLANGESTTYNEWPNLSQTPKSGTDCSNLVLLAAQSTHIPYFCKNSLAALNTLRPVTTEPLEIGDLIWVVGHLMIVADLERNTLIEARGYDHGYGKVQEIPLSEEFRGIETYQQLLECCRNNQSLERIDKYGNVVGTVQAKLLKLT